MNEVQDTQATTAQTATADASASSSSFNTGATAFKVSASAFTPGGMKQTTQEDSFSFDDLANQT